MTCMTRMVVVTAATDGGLLSPLRECAMWGANAQNGSNQRRMVNTPTRRRNGDKPADFVPSVVDIPSRMLIPHSVEWALGLLLSHPTVMGPTRCKEHTTSFG